MFRCILSFFIAAMSMSLLWACTPQDPVDTTVPKLMSSTPSDKAVDVNVNTVISMLFTEKIIVNKQANITLNNKTVVAKEDARSLIIETTLEPSTQYVLNIPANAIANVAGNYMDAFSISFTTAAMLNNQGNVFEAENALLTGDAVKATTIAGYSGTGYVNTNNGNVVFAINMLQDGYYDVFLRYISGGAKSNDLHINNAMAANIHFSQIAAWKEEKIATVKLKAGENSISIVKNWGNVSLDYLKMSYLGNATSTFNIDANLVTPQPSTQAVKLYDFLKENFTKKVISGAMAAHSTNINEAQWVFDKTGKWPALVGFDFIDHTWLKQNWVNYDAPFTLGQDYWNKNGLVTLTWHWRDPLTKSGAFYTADTNFDVSKVNDVNSNEYKAMIVDIDTIASYLKAFKNANIPVLWRPLHEAQGRWFWWGAKGPEHCKTLWRLMFNRLVKHHGLNNLIWIWTTEANDDAINWYPGDQYVDILGMDIYPGANQHGSQYISFNKVKEIFGGKKLIALSECGSAPDPALMLEYGDMWSWFMPWNGDFTRSDSHNGAAWWQKFFNYDFVLTRDGMPELK